MDELLYDPQVAAKLAAYVNYFCPVQGAKEVLQRTDPKLAANPLIFPDAATQARLQGYPPAVAGATSGSSRREMQKVTGA